MEWCRPLPTWFVGSRWSEDARAENGTTTTSMLDDNIDRDDVDLSARRPQRGRFGCQNDADELDPDASVASSSKSGNKDHLGRR